MYQYAIHVQFIHSKILLSVYDINITQTIYCYKFFWKLNTFVNDKVHHLCSLIWHTTVPAIVSDKWHFQSLKIVSCGTFLQILDMCTFCHYHIIVLCCKISCFSFLFVAIVWPMNESRGYMRKRDKWISKVRLMRNISEYMLPMRQLYFL